MSEKVRLNLRVEKDIPAILERLAGGRNEMGNYLTELIGTLDRAGAMNEMYHIDRRQAAVEDYVAELVLRVRYLERKIAGKATHWDQVNDALVQSAVDITEKAWRGPKRREDEEQTNE